MTKKTRKRKSGRWCQVYLYIYLEDEDEEEEVSRIMPLANSLW